MAETVVRAPEGSTVVEDADGTTIVRAPEDEPVVLEVQETPHPPRPSASHPRVGKMERRRQRGQSLIVFAIFAAIYGVIGYRMTTHGVIVFDALDRLTRAYMVWWNDPPKLAAIGFVFPPITSLIYLPAAAIKPVATSLVAIPLTTVPLAAGTMVVINSVLRRCEMPLPLRAVILLAFGLNPLWVFYAGNGMSEAVYIFFLTGGVAAFIGFYITEETRYLMGTGIGLTLAGLTRYGFLIWAILIALLVGAMLGRRQSSGDRMEGSIIAASVPIIYGFALWTLFNAVIVGRPFGWLTDATTNLAVNSNQVAATGHVTVDKLAQRLFEVILAVSPLAVVIIPVLLFTYFARRSDMALWLAALVSLAIVLFAGTALTSNDIGLLTLRSSLPIAVMAVLGLGWAYREAEGLRLIVYLAGLLLLVLAIPLTWKRMLHYPYQNQEQAFARMLRSGDDQTGKQSIGGYTVGVREEKAVAAFLKRTVGHRHNKVLVDNAQTFAVVLLTGRPEVFFDRVDKGDARWRQVLADPYGKVSYMLVSTSRSDLIGRRYAGIASGTANGFTPVFKTSRYTVVKVAARNPSKTTSTSGAARRRAATTRTGAARSSGSVQTSAPTFTPTVPAAATQTTTTTTTVPASSSAAGPQTTPTTPATSSAGTSTTSAGASTTSRSSTVTTP